MNQKELIISNIKQHLISRKLCPIKASQCADKAYQFYLTSIGNSKDPYKETCDHAGKLASGMDAKFKCKSPVSKTVRRVKKPQETLDL